MYDFRPARPPPEGTAACAGRSASCCRWLCSPAWPCRPRPRPPRRRQRSARHGLVVLQHHLRGRRPADRAGHRHQHRPAAPAAADRAPHLRHTWFPADTAAPGAGYGLGLEIYTLPCGATVAGHTGALPGYNSGSFRLLGDDKDARVVANLHPAPDELYVAFSNALVALFCDLTPAQAAAAARAHPDRAAVIRFR